MDNHALCVVNSVSRFSALTKTIIRDISASIRNLKVERFEQIERFHQERVRSGVCKITRSFIILVLHHTLNFGSPLK